MSSEASTFTYRTDGPGMWGLGKGANLTAEEVDLNFWSVEERLTSLETNPALPREISSISVSGNQMTITMQGGTPVYGPFTLPQAAFAFRGTYDDVQDESDSTMHVYDFFTANNGLYMALQEVETASSAFLATESNTFGPFWQLILPFPTVYDVGFFFPGLPGTGIDDGEALFSFRAAHSFKLPAELTDTVAGLQVATTEDLSFPIYKNTTAIGSVDFAATADQATFTFAADVTFAAGDKLRVLRPTVIDATARDFTLTFAGTKV